MKILEKVSKFFEYVKKGMTYDIDDYEENFEMEEQKQKLEKEQKIRNEMPSLLEKLENLKKQLENEELTPFKRFILQIKLSALETKIDKRLAYLEIEDIKKFYTEAKENIQGEYNTTFEILNEEYEQIFDKKYDLERQIESLSGNIQERKRTYEQINKSTENRLNTYQYRVAPKHLEELEEVQKQLEEVIKEQEEQERKIRQVQEELENRQKEIDENKENELKKYNLIAIQWNSIKTLFNRIKNNVKEFWNNKKIEREAVKKAKEESKANVRKTMAESDTKENDEKMKKFKEQLKYYEVIEENRPQEENEQVVEENEIQEENEQVVEENEIQEENEQVVEENEIQEENEQVVEENVLQEENGQVVEENESQEETQEIEEKQEQIDENKEETVISPILEEFIEELSKREEAELGEVELDEFKGEFAQKILMGDNPYNEYERKIGVEQIELYLQGRDIRVPEEIDEKEIAEKQANIKGKEKASELMKERQERAKNGYKYENNNYVPIDTKGESDEEIGR